MGMTEKKLLGVVQWGNNGEGFAGVARWSHDGEGISGVTRWSKDREGIAGAGKINEVIVTVSGHESFFF
jgi:hypothetical protein